MARPRRAAHAVATTERLLGAAEHAFAEHGFFGAKLEDIAAEAGVTRPSLLYHYGTKQDLYDAVVHRVFDDLGSVLTRAVDDALPFRDLLEHLLAAFMSFLSGRPAVSRLVLREVLDPDGPGHRVLLEAGDRILDWVEDLLRTRGGDALRPDLPVRYALMSLVSGLFVKISSGPLETPLWGEEDHLLALARLLFLREER